jgi:AcrR family transcriptional regulator
MTTGNGETMTNRDEGGVSDRFVTTTLELIAEEGGSTGVNLRQISRRMGCGHTNAYNYFDSYADLLWAAFRRGLVVYGEYLIHDLSREQDPLEYLRRAITNLAAFPEENPGLYRFIGSDPIDLATTPGDILETVTAMKLWFEAVVKAAASPATKPASARRAADIVLAYIDGETLNLINGRVIPSEDLRGRVVANALRLFDLLAGDSAGTPGKSRRRTPTPPDPALVFGA